MSKNIAITIQELEGLESRTDPQFACARAFIIVESKEKRIVTQFSNKAVAEPVSTGAGIADMIMKDEVDIVISGRYGPAGYDALESSGVEMWLAPEGTTVKNALDQFNAGTLSKATRGLKNEQSNIINSDYSSN